MTTVISVICVRLKYVIMITCRLSPKCIFLLILQFYRIFTPDMRFAFFIDIYITTTMGFTSLFPILQCWWTVCYRTDNFVCIFFIQPTLSHSNNSNVRYSSYFTWMTISNEGDEYGL